MWHLRSRPSDEWGWHLKAPDGVLIEADTEENLRKKYVEYCLQRGFPLLDIQEKITNLILRISRRPKSLPRSQRISARRRKAL